MTDPARQNVRPDPNDELKRLAVQSITDLGAAQATACVPSGSGHDDPVQRRAMVDAVFDDPRIKGAKRVTVTVPRGDTEALDEVRSRLEVEHTRSAGATVFVEGRPSPDAARATTTDCDVPRRMYPACQPSDLDRAAEAADALSTDRDLRADTRDLRADTRDERADRRDQVSGRGDANAAADRSAARGDRQASAGDRRHAKADREAAGTDRRTSAGASTLVRDDLTGSYVRGPGMRELDREVIRAKRTGQAFALVLIDVDGLAATNDTLGHQAGDRVLNLVATAVQARVREYDVVVRYGGGELICGLLDCSVAAVRQRFDGLAADLAASGCAAVCSGVVQLEPDEELDDLIARADHARNDQRRRQAVSGKAP